MAYIHRNTIVNCLQQFDASRPDFHIMFPSFPHQTLLSKPPLNLCGLVLITTYLLVVSRSAIVSWPVALLDSVFILGYGEPVASLWRACSEPVASLFYQHKHAISYQQHAVVRNRALVALSLGYAIPTDAPDYGIHAQQLNDLNTSNKFNTLNKANLE